MTIYNSHALMYIYEQFGGRMSNLGGSRFVGRGRSYTKYTYTYLDIASLTGLSYHTVRKYASMGIFNPSSLLSVAKFLLERGVLA